MKMTGNKLLLLVLAGSVLVSCGTGDTAKSAEETTRTEVASTESTETSSGQPENGSEASLDIQTLDQTEGKYPIRFDLTELYASNEAWQQDYDQVWEDLDAITQFRGQLHTAEGLLAYLEYSEGGNISERINRLESYAYLGNSIDGTQANYRTMLARVNDLYSRYNEKKAFFEDEIYHLSFAEREKLFSDPLLLGWEYQLAPYLDANRKHYSEEANALLAVRDQSSGIGNSIYETLLAVDMPDPEIELPDGTKITMTEAEYGRILESQTYSQELKEEALRLSSLKSKPYMYTITALLEATIKENWVRAQIDGYENSRAAALDRNRVESEIYDYIVDAVHEGLPTLHKYYALHKQGLGLAEQHSYDLGRSVSGIEPELVPYDDGVEIVRKALLPMGEEYLSCYDRMTETGHIDVYPGDNKTGGGYMLPSITEVQPYVLLNYDGGSDSVSTLAHELGHAIYGSFSQFSQPVQSRNPKIFTQEVASTLNELHYYDYMRKHAVTDAEKLYYLEAEIQLLNGTIFTQIQYAEFEDALYREVEAGNSLQAEDLNERFEVLRKTYYGDAVTMLPEQKYRWQQIPHFHYNYYVYQYATSMTYACSLYAEMSGDNSAEAYERYLAFLKAGDSAQPSALLRIAGVDPLEKETYERAMAFYSDLVDEYEELINKMG